MVLSRKKVVISWRVVAGIKTIIKNSGHIVNCCFRMVFVNPPARRLTTVSNSNHPSPTQHYSSTASFIAFVKRNS